MRTNSPAPPSAAMLLRIALAMVFVVHAWLKLSSVGIAGVPRLDPWDTSVSSLYRAALAALAVGTTSPVNRDRPDIREHLSALIDYLRCDQPSQPLRNRRTLLWAFTNLHGLLPHSGRDSIINEVLQNKEFDGGWSLESLGSGNSDGQPVSAGTICSHGLWGRWRGRGN